MTRNNGFKPPTSTTQKKVAKPLKRQVSYTDAEYEEIFSSAINGPVAQPIEILAPEAKKSPSQAETSEFQEAIMPCESASVQQHSEDPKKKRDTSSLSTLNSEDFAKNATSSTQITSITFRDALNMSRTSLKLSQASASVVSGPLSQAPAHLSHRKRLEWLQARRGVGLWVRCDREQCLKWRYLDIQDPVDVPSNWHCSLNPDTNYNDCKIPEQKRSLYVEEDMIHNAFTAGSIVWAKHDGFPWWPAMVDDCPDTEQYYWVDGYSDVPVYYNVVFFDNTKVERAWIETSCLISYKKFRNYDTHFRKSTWYTSRLVVAKRLADMAVKLPIMERLKQFSFLARWPNDILTPSPSEDSDDSENTVAIKAEKKKQCHANRKRSKKETRRKDANRRNSLAASSDETDAETQQIVNICEREQKEIRRRRKVKTKRQQIVHLQQPATYIDINENVATHDDKVTRKRQDDAAKVDSLESIEISSDDEPSNAVLFVEDVEPQNAQGIQEILEDLRSTVQTQNRSRELDAPKLRSVHSASFDKHPAIVEDNKYESKPKQKGKQKVANPSFKEPTNKPSPKNPTIAISPIGDRKPVKKGFIPPLLKSRNASPASSTKSFRSTNGVDSSTISPHSSQTAGPSVHGIAVVPNTDDNVLAVLDDLGSCSDPFDLDD